MPLSPIAPFANHLPVQIRFGAGAIAELPGLLTQLGVARPAVVVDPNVLALTPIADVLAEVRAAWAEALVLPIAPGEPSIDTIEATARDVIGADVVVGIGGGSALDVAKGARLLATHEGGLRDYTFPAPTRAVGPIGVPLVTVPTTAGTGSEVSGGIVASDPQTHVKVGAPSPHNRADHCLFDPTLTYRMPRQPTLYGGVDALAQAIAAVVVAVTTPVATAVGLEAVRLAAEALPRLAADGGDTEARDAMACASLMAGLAMNLAEVGSEHSLGHAVGALCGAPHGLTVGVVLAESLEHDRRFVPEALERVATALGEPDDGSGDGSRAVRAIQRLLATIGFPTLASCGVAEADVPRLVELALTGWIPVTPGPWTADDVAAAYRRALALGDVRRVPVTAGDRA